MTSQRMKGQGNQVSNGPKDHVTEHEDFDSWRNQHHQVSQGYTPSMSTSMASEPYVASYYGSSFYQTFGVGDGTWSNGDPIPFLGGYGGQMGHDSYNLDGMFGGTGFGGFGQPAAGFNYGFHGNGGDYSGWGGASAVRKQYDDYYRGGGEAGIYDERLKSVDQGMGALAIGADPNKDPSKELIKDSSKNEVSGAKKLTWATIASQPAKPQPSLKKKSSTGGPSSGIPPPPLMPGKHNLDIGTWDGKNGSGPKPVAPPPAPRPAWGAPRGRPAAYPIPATAPVPNIQPAMPPTVAPSHPVLDDLRLRNTYNPSEYDLSPKLARFFVIKSYSEDDIHRSIKYEIWCSTEHGNKRLDTAFRDRESKGGSVLLFFSVNGSGHFCGMAQMTSPLDYEASSSVWSQDKWKGQFRVKWIYVKDVPNAQLRHIRLENNENKPVTNSRDTQEVPYEKGKQVLRIMHQFHHSTSIFDDFVHYEKRQEEEDHRRVQPPPMPLPKEREVGPPAGRGRGSNSRGSRN